MVINGSLCTKEIADFLSSNNVEVIVSLDGPARYHKSDNNGWFNVGYEDLKGIDAENFLFGISNGEGVEIDFSFATKIDRIIEAVLNASEKKTWIEVSNEKEWKT